MRSQLKNDPWRTISHLARPYRNQFLVVIVLASLSTSADLVEPLIYRVAVNDVAGLFVQRAHEEGRAELERTANPRTVKPVERDGGRLEGVRQSREPHRRGHIAPRTPSQTLSTLLWAVVLLFVINVAGYFLWLLADNLTVALGCRIEKSFLYQVFGHVLRLPLNFFAKRASGALAKRIDQLDQVSPIVNAFAQQIAPDVVRVVGILIIMFTQSWMLTLVALITLPPYLWVARRSASKLERGLSGITNFGRKFQLEFRMRSLPSRQSSFQERKRAK